MSARIAIGFGSTSAARVGDIVQLVYATFATLSDPTYRASTTVLATLDRRAAMAREIARILGCTVVTFDAQTLAAVDGTTTVSLHALASVGTASVAEAAALAALRPFGRLVAARMTGHNCTCAIAERP